MIESIHVSQKPLAGVTVAAAILLAPFALAERPGDLPPRFEIREMIDEHQEPQKEWVEERREFAESLRNLFPEDRRAAIEAFREENANRIAAHEEVAEVIAENMRAEVERPERDHDIGRPELPDDVQDMIAEFQSARESLIEERRATIDEFQAATREQLDEALADLREKQQESIDAQRELARSIRDEVADLREDRRNNR